MAIDPEIKKGAYQGLVNMLKLNPGENICIVTDAETLEDIGNVFIEVAKEITDEEKVVVYNLDEHGERPLQEMPEGYQLRLTEEGGHYYWHRLSDEGESSICWDKWAVYRGALADSINNK